MGTTKFSSLKQSGLMNRKINDKQRRFVAEYVVDYDGKKAAELAGYKNPSVAARRLLDGKTYPQVTALIADIQASNLQKTMIEKDEIISHLVNIIRRDPLEMFEVDSIGRATLKSLKDMPLHVRQNIDGMKTKKIRSKDGDVIGHEVEVTMPKRLDAIEKLMRHLGMYREEIEVKHSLDWDALYERRAGAPDKNEEIENHIATLEGQAKPHVPKLKGPTNGQREKSVSQKAGKRNQRKESGSKSKTLGGKAKAKRQTPKQGS